MENSALQLFGKADSLRAKIESFLTAVDLFSVLNDMNNSPIFAAEMKTKAQGLLPDAKAAIETLSRELAINWDDSTFPAEKFLLISRYAIEYNCDEIKRIWPELRAKLEFVSLRLEEAEAEGTDDTEPAAGYANEELQDDFGVVRAQFKTFSAGRARRPKVHRVYSGARFGPRQREER